jgi:hypothetical protein
MIFLPSARNRFVKLPSGPHFIDPAGPTIYRHSGNYNKKTTLWVAKIQLSLVVTPIESQSMYYLVHFSPCSGWIDAKMDGELGPREGLGSSAVNCSHSSTTEGPTCQPPGSRLRDCRGSKSPRKMLPARVRPRAVRWHAVAYNCTQKEKSFTFVFSSYLSNKIFNNWTDFIFVFLNFLTKLDHKCYIIFKDLFIHFSVIHLMQIIKHKLYLSWML